MFSLKNNQINEEQSTRLLELAQVFTTYCNEQAMHSSLGSFLSATFGLSSSQAAITLDTYIRERQEHLRISTLFSSLNYESFFEFTKDDNILELDDYTPNISETFKTVLNIHKELKLSLNAEDKFFPLMKAVQKAMEAGTLTKETAQDMRSVIDHVRSTTVSIKKDNSSMSGYGTTNTALSNATSSYELIQTSMRGPDNKSPILPRPSGLTAKNPEINQGSLMPSKVSATMYPNDNKSSKTSVLTTTTPYTVPKRDFFDTLVDGSTTTVTDFVASRHGYQKLE